MYVCSSYSLFEEAFYYIKSKHQKSSKLVELPKFLEHFNSIIDGFHPGEVTLISGKETDAFFTSLLHDLSIEKNVYTYVISNRYSECYIGLNLLKYEMAKLKPWNLCLYDIYSGNFEDEQIEKLEKDYYAMLENREGKGKNIPIFLSRFTEKNIEEICENIRNEIQTIDSNKGDDFSYKRIVIINGINIEDLQQIKTLAEIYHVPVIVFMKSSEASPYADNEIIIKQAPVQYPSLPSKFRMFPVQITNNILLMKGESDIKFDCKLKAFVSDYEPDDNNESSKPAITQQEIDDMLKKG